MRKANQPTKATTIEVSPTDLAGLLEHFDLSAKTKAQKLQQVKDHKYQIRYAKESITNYSKSIGDHKQTIQTLLKEIEALPPSSVTADILRARLEAVARLPWVGSMVLTGENLMITTEPGVLKTTFHDRVVYKDGNRANELLDRPLTLPMPTYDISIGIQNMGGSWHRTENLKIRLHDVETLKFHPGEGQLGLSQYVIAHWASGENAWTPNSRRDPQWGTLCLDQYQGAFSKGGQEGLMELLNEIVIFLQTAGWARAYQTKMNWMMMLGFHPYATNLLRPLLPNESFEQIQESNRTRLPTYLKENGLTEHMYQYGSRAENEPQGLQGAGGAGGWGTVNLGRTNYAHILRDAPFAYSYTPPTPIFTTDQLVVDTERD